MNGKDPNGPGISPIRYQVIKTPSTDPTCRVIRMTFEKDCVAMEMTLRQAKSIIDGLRECVEEVEVNIVQ